LRPCRELNRAIREIFPLIRESALVHFLAFALTTNAIVPDRPRLCREGKEGAARCSKAPKPISRPKPAFVHVKGARHSRKFGRQVRRREQTAFRASRWRRRSCRALPDAPAPPKLRDRTPFGHTHDAASVDEKSLGTLSPSPRRSATVDALRAIGELDLSELD
jgi:hypothetical protein